MVSTLTRPGRQLAKQILLLESGVVLVTAILVMCITGVNWGISALFGGSIFVLANALFSVCAFLFSGARAARYVVVSFFGGVVLKILLTVVLFSVAFLYAEVELIPLKLAYLLVLGVNFFAPVLFINNNK